MLNPQYVAIMALASFVLLALWELASPGFARRPRLSKGRSVANFGLGAINLLMVFALPITLAGAALWAAERGIGLLHNTVIPAVVIFAVALISRSFAAYWVHRALHHVPILWRVHRVHHSDTEFDISLSLRNHPLEAIPAFAAQLAVVIGLGLPVWAVLACDAVLLAASYWEHCDRPIPKRFAHWLHTIVMTPNAHRIHHSSDQHETDSNFGSLFSVWDRMFRTWSGPDDGIVQRIGLGDHEDARANHLGKQLLLPFSR